MALQHELAQSRAQVLAVTQRLDQLTQSHQLLNSEADRLFREKADQISTLETRLSATLFKQGFDLLDLKSMRPERFDGKRNEAWKSWQASSGSDKFFDYGDLDKSELEEIMKDNFRQHQSGQNSYVPLADADGDVMPDIVDSSSDDGGPRTTKDRRRRDLEKRALCKRVRVSRRVLRIERRNMVPRRIPNAQGMDIHATMWSGWRCQMTDQMSVEWMRFMMRINESVAAVFARERNSRSERGDALIRSSGDALRPLCSDDDITLEPASKGQVVVVTVGTDPSDGGRNQANDEASREPASSISEPIGVATGSGAVFAPQVEANEDREVSVVTKARPARRVGSRRLQMARGITVDSGAADNVMPRRLLRSGMKMRPSQASRAGVHCVAANSARIPNEGEADFIFQDKDGKNHSWTFQIAEVNKVLASVSAMVDSGHRVVFDRDDATGTDLSFRINKKTGNSIRMRRDRTVWVIDAFLDDDEDFSRQE